MAKFTSVKPINSRWRNQDFVGGANSTHTIPNEMYDEFTADWAYKISIGDIVVTETPTTGNIQAATLTVGDIVLTGTATGNFGSGASTTVVGTSPIAVSTSSNTATVSLTASYSSSTHDHTGVYQVAGNYSSSTHNHSGTYQPAGTYVTSVSGSSPISATGTTAATISITSGTAPSNYVLGSDGAGGVGWIAQTGGTGGGGGLSTIVGTSPITASILGSTATVGIDSSITTAENARRVRTLVRNTTASTITKGSVVYIDGSSGTVPTIQNALANADATSARTFGIVETDIASNTDGYVTNQGLLTGLNTNATGIVDGAVLWLSASVAGAYTTTKPSGPNHGVLVGIVVKGGSAGAGSIYVLVKNGAELDEIHDVNISGLANGDTLIYSSTASVWQNTTLASAGIASTSHTHAYETSGAVATHEAASNPHSAYLLSANAATTYLLSSAAATTYQAKGTYVTSVTGDASVSASGTTAISLAHTGTDGYHHVPATGITNSGKFLKAGATAGSEAWASVAQSDVTNLTTDLSTINTAVTSAQTTANTANTTANNAVPKSTVTTKGDLIVASAASAVARLGVGTDGQILTARSTATNGVAWETAAAGSGSTTITFNTVTTAYTLVLTDKDKMVQSTSAAALNITCPANSTTAFATGDQIHLLQAGAGQVTVVAATGVTINATYGLKLRAQWSAATLIKRATDTWVLIGDTVV